MIWLPAIYVTNLVADDLGVALSSVTTGVGQDHYLIISTSSDVAESSASDKVTEAFYVLWAGEIDHNMRVITVRSGRHLSKRASCEEADHEGPDRAE